MLKKSTKIIIVLSSICMLGLGTKVVLSYNTNDESLLSNNINENSSIYSNYHINNISNNDVKNNEDQKVETIIAEASMSSDYLSFKNLLLDSQIIIEGTVLEVSYFDYNEIPRTQSKINVTKSYNNNAKEGDIITLIESGGETTVEKMDKYSGADKKFPDKKSKEDKDKKIRYSLNGSDTSKVGDNILVFAAKNDFYQLNEIAYIPVGSYLGKFNIKNNILKRYLGGEESLSGNADAKSKIISTKNDVDIDTITDLSSFRKTLESYLKK